MSERRAGAQQGAIAVRLVLGLLAVAFGLVFLGGNLGYLDTRSAFRTLWPLAFVAVGVAILLTPRGRGASNLWGLVWVVAGAWIFASQRGLVRVDFWDVFFPGALLVLGASLVWRALAGPRTRAPRAEAPGDAYVRSFALMAGNELRSSARAFRGADLGAFMGGVVLDLRQAEMAGDEAEVDVFAMWGGIELKVPKEWGVESRVVPLMAGYEDKTRAASTAPAKRLVVRGFVIMGAVEVTN
jgi:hypothetical protein